MSAIKNPLLPHAEACCVPSQPFDRLSYLYGQVLTPAHLRRAQESIYEKFKLHQRCLAGWGVACGLWVEAVPMPTVECPPKVPHQDAPPPAKEGAQAAKPIFPPDLCHVAKTKIHIECGVAVDCEGNDLVVRAPLEVELYGAMSPADRQRVADGLPHTVWVSLEYQRFGFEPIRALRNDCQDSCEGSFAFEREGLCVKVVVDTPPAHHDRCETCCTCCEHESVLLARIDDYVRGVRVGTVFNGVRRPLTTYVPTVITGINWNHASHYQPADLDHLVYEVGLQVQFSRKLQPDTVVEGIFDVYIYELGSGRSGTVRVLQGDVTLEASHDRLTYRGRHSERIDPGDRVMIVFRADHVLDHCCRPVDGNHVGGWVPALPDAVPATIVRGPVACATPKHPMPLTSGNGSPGGSFESWVFAIEQDGQVGKGKS